MHYYRSWQLYQWPRTYQKLVAEHPMLPVQSSSSAQTPDTPRLHWIHIVWHYYASGIPRGGFGFRRLFQTSFRWIARSSRTAANTSDPFQHCTLGPIVHYIYWESQWVTRHFKVEGKKLQSDSDNYYFLAFFATFPDSSPPRPLLRRALTYSRLKGKHWILTMCVKLTDVDLQWLAVDLQP